MRRHPFRRNALPTRDEVVSIAKDMVKEGKIAEAEKVLLDEGVEPTGGIFFSAVADKLREGGKAARAEAGKLFRRVRKKYREFTLPHVLRVLVPFTEANVRMDHAIAEDIDVPGGEDDFEVATLRGTDLHIHKLEYHGEPAFEVNDGNQEFMYVRNEDVANRCAVREVEERLNDDATSFDQNFLMDHVDMEKFREVVRDMVMNDDYWDEIAQHETDRFWKDAAQAGLDVPEEDEDGDMPSDVDQKFIDEMKEITANDRVKDPMDYISDFMDAEQRMEWIRDNVGFDIPAAAQAAVSADGAGTWLSSWDGETRDTVSGFVYWRNN